MRKTSTNNTRRRGISAEGRGGRWGEREREGVGVGGKEKRLKHTLIFHISFHCYSINVMLFSYASKGRQTRRIFHTRQKEKVHISIYTRYKRLSYVGQRPTCPVEGVVVDVVEILPA